MELTRVGTGLGCYDVLAGRRPSRRSQLPFEDTQAMLATNENLTRPEACSAPWGASSADTGDETPYVREG
jgi:hypothetical protein